MAVIYLFLKLDRQAFQMRHQARVELFEVNNSKDA